jgi:hypothetical protein
MKTFQEFLAERLEVPNEDKGLDKQRYAMPQLSDFASFTKDLNDHDISMIKKLVRPDRLTPTQAHFDEDKVNALAENGWDHKPIISSKDGFVVDGHHRWLAAQKLGKPIHSQVIGMNCEDLLKFCKDKPYVKREKLDGTPKS